MTSRIHYRACNLCEAICGLEITVENDKITQIVGDKNDPLCKGYLCPKAYALKDIYEDPNRLKQPIRKCADGSWETIGWDEAYDYVADNLKRVQAEHGQNAVGIYLGNPSVHNWGTTMNSPAFIKSLKTKNIFSATSLDQLPSHFAAWAMFGHPLLIPIPDVSRTDFMLIMGGNPLASNGSLMTAPDMGKHLKNIQKRSGKVVVIDPRRTETAEKGTEHHFIRPASDVFLLLGMLNVILISDKEQPKLEIQNPKYTEGVEKLKEAVAEFTPERVAAQTGMSAEAIRKLAHEFATAQSAVAYGRMGLSVQKFGGLCQWLINCLNIVTGNFDKMGGAMFTSPAVDILAKAQHRNLFGRWKSRVRGLPEFMGETPVSALAEEILTPSARGEGQIRAMITNAGNPILSSPNGRQLDKAFESLDFMVSIDIYLNETTRHAHIILPPATGLETSHYDMTFHIFSVRNTAKYSPPLFPKGENQRYDWEIFQELTHRMTNTEGGVTPNPPEEKLDLGLRFGAYKLSLQQLLDEPSGVDLGDLQPVLPNRLAFEDKKIRLAPDVFLQDLERVKDVLKNESSFQKLGDFQLIGRRHLRDNNSWMHNSEKLMKGKNRCTVMMNTDDAAALQIIDKQVVKVTSRVGSIELPVEITADIMRGVVSIPHGYGHNREGTNLDVAQQFAGASMNDLTDEMEIDDLTGNAVLNGVLVRIEVI